MPNDDSNRNDREPFVVQEIGTRPESASPIRTFSVTGLFVLAVLYSLYFAADFILPVVLAVLMSLFLLPVVRFLRKAGIPEPLGAAAAILGLIILILAVGSLVTRPFAGFLQDFPLYLDKIKDRVSFLSVPLQDLSQAAKHLEQMTGSSQSSALLSQDSLLRTLFNQMPVFVARLVIVVVLTYFLLAHGEFFLRKTVKILPTLKDKRRIVEISREIEWSISRYLASVTLLNLALGTSVGISAGLLGVTNPLMWGGTAFLLNYVPFIGSACGIVFIAIATLIQFENPWYALLAPGAYLFLNAMESNFITPHIVGRWMTLNPVAIVLSFLFWGWLWGALGMLLAVPILAVIKIICDHIDRLVPFGEFLGG